MAKVQFNTQYSERSESYFNEHAIVKTEDDLVSIDFYSDCPESSDGWIVVLSPLRALRLAEVIAKKARKALENTQEAF